MSMVIRLKVPIEMHYTVIPMGTYKVNSSLFDFRAQIEGTGSCSDVSRVNIV